MKSVLYSLLLAACAGMGCLSMPTWWEKTKTAPPSTLAAKPARPRAAVTADQITDGNAQEMAGALLDELDRDAQAQSMPSTEKTAGEVKPADSKRR
jgi:hypothetical protein